jgi:hypothetical protein
LLVDRFQDGTDLSRWEHDPAWAYTSKLLISKHQQVQLLEAASVLVTMTDDGPTPLESLHLQDSEEGSSASPGFSASSEIQDELSSTETTPPPMSDTALSFPSHKRYSSGSSPGFSRSYRSIPSSSFAESMASPGLPPQRLGHLDYHPSAIGIDDGGLAAAAELLNFGTPRTKPTQMSADIPPVPPLPEQYQQANKFVVNDPLPTVYNPLGMHPISQPISDERDSKVPEREMVPRSRRGRTVHTDDDDDGMFRMEE